MKPKLLRAHTQFGDTGPVFCGWLHKWGEPFMSDLEGPAQGAELERSLWIAEYREAFLRRSVTALSESKTLNSLKAPKYLTFWGTLQKATLIRQSAFLYPSTKQICSYVDIFDTQSVQLTNNCSNYHIVVLAVIVTLYFICLPSSPLLGDSVQHR